MRGSFLPGGGSGAGFFVGDTVSLALALSITFAEMSWTSVAVVSVVIKVLFPFLGGIWSVGMGADYEGFVMKCM